MAAPSDASILPGFPRKLSGSANTGDGASSPVLVDLNGDNRNELVVGGSDGIIHAFRPDGSELPGWPVHTDPLPLHTGERAFDSGDVPSDAGGAVLASIAADDVDHDGVPEVFAADMQGQVYGWRADGQSSSTSEANPDYSGKPLSPFVNSRHGKFNRTQHGFIGSPVLADLDGDGTQEVIAASMDRHVYAWHMNGDPVAGFPVLVVDPSKVQSIDPATHQITFNANAGSDSRGRSWTRPPSAISTGHERPSPRSWSGPTRSTTATAMAGANAGPDQQRALCGREFRRHPQPRQHTALRDQRNRRRRLEPEPQQCHPPGWPARIGIVSTELLPVVGEGITGSPAIGPVNCPSGGQGAKITVMPDAGLSYVLNPNGQSCYGRDANGNDRVLNSVIPGGNPQKYDLTTTSAVGHPAFANLGGIGTGLSVLGPATGLIRSLDIGVNEYQGGQDFAMAWDASTGQPRAGWPLTVNDLQFLTGPAAADIDGQPGDEVIGGTASFDLFAANNAGQPRERLAEADRRLDGGDPAIGSFGTVDTDAGVAQAGDRA